MEQHIRALRPEDWDAVKNIYQQGIATQLATFQTACPAWEEWNATYLPDCRYVYVLNGRVVGWAALSPVSDHCVFAGVAEISIYIAAAARGKGIGSELLQRLMAASAANGIWTLQSSIIQENAASIALHRKCGFREVGYRERIARDSRGQWRNLVLMEWRSPCDSWGCGDCH